MMPDNFEQEKYYDKRAPEYEQIYFRDNPPRRKEIDDEADRVRELVKNKTVLDIACGTGYWTQIFSETASKITACDLSTEMINQAKQKKYITKPNFIRCNLNPTLGPPITKEESATYTSGQKWSMTLKSLLPPLVLILSVMGTILAGVATPTEAAGLGAFGAFILAALNRKLNWTVLKESSFANVAWPFSHK